jgi:hypothetical protein
MPADFKLQNKKVNDLATDMLTVGDLNAAASAFATQTARGNKPTTKGTDASAFANGARTAGAYALNIDPYAVEWDSLSNRSITLDLTGIVLKALTSGDSSTAVATMDILGSFINGTDNTTLPIDSSSPLFTLSFGATDFDDAAAQGVADISFLGLSADACALRPATDPCKLAIRDTFIDPVTGTTRNSVGLIQVLADLTQSFGPLASGSFGITGSFSIVMDVPGSSPTSLMFLNEIDTAVTQAVPEPSSFVLLLLGLPVLLFTCRGALSRA